MGTILPLVRLAIRSTVMSALLFGSFAPYFSKEQPSNSIRSSSPVSRGSKFELPRRPLASTHKPTPLDAVGSTQHFTLSN